MSPSLQWVLLMKQLLAGIVLLAIAGFVSAEGLSLGATDVPVADRSAEARTEALGRALDQVLVRLTGRRALSEVPGLSGVRTQPSRWTRQFSYRQANDTLMLSATFDVNAVLAELEKAGAPVWGLTRPQVLFWLVIQRPGTGELLARETPDPARATLQEVARERGLPLLLPVMDDQDRSAIAVADIRGHFDRVLHQASARYQTPLRVAAVLYTGARPQVRWRLFRESELIDQGQYETDDETQALRQLVDQVADRLTSIYVVNPGSASVLALDVDGVGSLAQWHALQGYLEKLSGVSQVRLLRLQGSTVSFNMVFSGGVDQLQQLLALNPGLAPCADVVPGAVAGLPRYCWQSR